MKTSPGNLLEIIAADLLDTLHTGPHQISVNASHIPAPVPHLPRNIDASSNWHLAPIKTITGDTYFLRPSGKTCNGPNWQGLSTGRGYKPSWCFSPQVMMIKINSNAGAYVWFGHRTVTCVQLVCQRISWICHHWTTLIPQSQRTVPFYTQTISTTSQTVQH